MRKTECVIVLLAFALACDSRGETRSPEVGIRETANFAPQDIKVSYEWIEHRPTIPKGSSLEQVSKLLGGAAEKANFRDDKRMSGFAWWTFCYQDSFDNTLYMSCQAEFQLGQLLEILWMPQGWRDNGKNYKNKITVAVGELTRRMSLITNALSMADVSKVLGGQPFTGHINEKGNGKAFWRFELTEAKDENSKSAIYQCEFINGRMVTGFILPH